MWIIDWAGNSRVDESNTLTQLSMLRHYEPLLKGLFSSADVAYFLLIIVLFIGFSIRRLDATRLQP